MLWNESERIKEGWLTGDLKTVDNFGITIMTFDIFKLSVEKL